MDEIRTSVTSDGIHTLFLGCLVISDLQAEDAKAFAAAVERQRFPHLPRAMPLSFFMDLVKDLEPRFEPVRADV
jgi:hypothetical protein